MDFSQSWLILENRSSYPREDRFKREKSVRCFPPISLNGVPSEGYDLLLAGPFRARPFFFPLCALPVRH
ncbi:hypothetical protein EJ077_25140 [Mesorhizobium sp. M8A.F.Ca.ET.057.01.1.1]|uniref:hypothetical protein n=1 Tax=Mesorhizobium sp. M8A.F.Ca.ET.057.01.1.1 TaxID=2493679 RepID=UPI000F7512C6|nr:hypothetical protein [Mesorhizobium sp. M8A.F.Ca.ET.057.01.1.1]AZO56325.1 hypothetical protein EJ077_25140 [Mesorhizobium sp. M8A.F.Ca.ET.057.01.1.1]